MRRALRGLAYRKYLKDAKVRIPAEVVVGEFMLSEDEKELKLDEMIVFPVGELVRKLIIEIEPRDDSSRL